MQLLVESKAGSQTITETHLQGWPKAVEEIVKIDDNAAKTAKGLLALIQMRVETKDKTILDFGCGEGYIAASASTNTKKIVAYDIKDKIFAPSDKMIKTTDYDQVTKEGPYDIIICHDVLDHIEPISTIEENTHLEPLHISTLRKLSELLTEQGKIHIRCHPWTSRHGGHIYRQQNMAFLHMILSDQEYEKSCMLTNVQVTHRIYRPLEYYNRCIEKSGLKITSVTTEHQDIEPFVIDKLLAKIIESWPNPKPNTDELKELLKINFIDYIISRG
jgi:hypothetical protein